MNTHEHRPDGPALGRYEVCECGATREAPARGKPAGAWHTCDRCVAAHWLTIERCAKVCEGSAVVKFTPQQGWYDQDDGSATLATAAAAIRALPLTTGKRCPRCGLDTGDELHRTACPVPRLPPDPEDVEHDRRLDGDPERDDEEPF